jgi:hypothetical protein
MEFGGFIGGWNLVDGIWWMEFGGWNLWMEFVDGIGGWNWWMEL